MTAPLKYTERVGTLKVKTHDIPLQWFHFHFEEYPAGKAMGGILYTVPVDRRNVLGTGVSPYHVTVRQANRVMYPSFTISDGLIDYMKEEGEAPTTDTDEEVILKHMRRLYAQAAQTGSISTPGGLVGGWYAVAFKMTTPTVTTWSTGLLRAPFDIVNMDMSMTLNCSALAERVDSIP